MILNNFYETVLEKIIGANIGVNYMDLWNDQIRKNEEEDDYLSFNYPAVFIEYNPITWETLGRKKQAAEVTFNLIVAFENYHESSNLETQEERKKAFEAAKIINNLFSLLQGFNKVFSDGSGFGSISRNGVVYEHEGADQIITFSMPFKTRMVDASAMPNLIRKETEFNNNVKL